MSKDTQKPVILYHNGCPDGFAGAWAAWKKLGDGAEYIPVHHSEPIPDAVDGRTVYLIDFMYTQQEDVDEITRRAKQVILLDHHVGAQQFLNNCADGSVFDLDRSGATIAWNYFHPDQPVPRLLKYVEAIDLGYFDMENAKEIDQLTSLYEYRFEVWDELIADMEDDTQHEKYVAQGRLLLKKLEREVSKLANMAEEVMFEGVRCKMVNTPLHASYVAQALLDERTHMAMLWSRRGKKIIVSLRSDSQVDVRKIAEKYGGGGHPRSSAFRWDTDHILHIPGIVACDQACGEAAVLSHFDSTTST